MMGYEAVSASIVGRAPADLLGSGVIGEVLGYLAAQLAVAEPALRGGGGGGGGHRDYLRKGESE